MSRMFPLLPRECAAESDRMPETIEAEVIEIDGEKPQTLSQQRKGPSVEEDPRVQFKKVFFRFGRPTGPGSILLGILLAGVLLVSGAVFALLYLTFAIARGILRLANRLVGRATG